MKMISVLLLGMGLFAAAGAQAAQLNASANWATIVASRGAQVSWPVVQFKEAAVSVASVCYDGSEVRTLDPVTYCADYRYDYEGMGRCEKYATSVLSTPRTHVTVACADYDLETGLCGHKVPSVSTYADEYDVPVSAWNAGGEGGPQYLFSKKFQVPSCR